MIQIKGVNKFTEEMYDALSMALTYIGYIEHMNPNLHKEADGSPSVTADILKALKYFDG